MILGLLLWLLSTLASRSWILSWLGRVCQLFFDASCFLLSFFLFDVLLGCSAPCRPWWRIVIFFIHLQDSHFLSPFLSLFFFLEILFILIIPSFILSLSFSLILLFSQFPLNFLPHPVSTMQFFPCVPWSHLIFLSTSIHFDFLTFSVFFLGLAQFLPSLIPLFIHHGYSTYSRVGGHQWSQYFLDSVPNFYVSCD